jgi:hypothetical protein
MPFILRLIIKQPKLESFFLDCAQFWIEYALFILRDLHFCIQAYLYFIFLLVTPIFVIIQYSRFLEKLIFFLYINVFSTLVNVSKEYSNYLFPLIDYLIFDF